VTHPIAASTVIIPIRDLMRLGNLGQMIKLLMRALGSESIRAKLYACATVWHLTKTEAARVLLIDAGVVERLLVRDG